MELETMYGQESELMGRKGYLQRRIRKLAPAHVRFLIKSHGLPLEVAKKLMGEEPELMGRSFWKRQAARTSKFVRPITSKALDIASKNPLTSSYAQTFRSVTASKPSFKLPGQPEPKPIETSNPALPATSWTPIKKVVVIGGGIVMLGVILAVVAKKKK